MFDRCFLGSSLNRCLCKEQMVAFVSQVALGPIAEERTEVVVLVRLLYSPSLLRR